MDVSRQASAKAERKSTLKVLDLKKGRKQRAKGVTLVVQLVQRYPSTYHGVGENGRNGDAKPHPQSPDKSLAIRSDLRGAWCS